MKLSEILKENDNDRQKIMDWLYPYLSDGGQGPFTSTVIIRPDGLIDIEALTTKDNPYRDATTAFDPIDVDGFVRPVLNGFPSFINFNKIDGGFGISDNNFTSLRGCPKWCKTFNANGNKNLSSLEHMPKVVTHLVNICDTNITSLSNINVHLTEMGGDGRFVADFEKITEGGIGLVLIPGLKHLQNWKQYKGLSSITSEPFKIIEKYIGKPNDVFDLQVELIDAGFEGHAQI